MNWRVPLSDIDFGAEESAAVQQVLESRWLTMGAVTQQFEAEFADYVGARHAIAVTNATAALHLACVAAGLGPGDEVDPAVPDFCGHGQRGPLYGRHAGLRRYQR